ncbi:hypothetical protein PAHAL_7G286100 [Panicum hallii]|uniref:Uncharacterized protein n=1 Tax=Panicum hallii TaxID=206008 RepID=A0A2T8IDQ6_9POAL|nr:hypothetical protein PAHAL_7G286100 [Panicum hallii]
MAAAAAPWTSVETHRTQRNEESYIIKRSRGFDFYTQVGRRGPGASCHRRGREPRTGGGNGGSGIRPCRPWTTTGRFLERSAEGEGGGGGGDLNLMEGVGRIWPGNGIGSARSVLHEEEGGKEEGEEGE